MKIPFGVLAAALFTWAISDVFPALGAFDPGPRVRRSPHFRDGVFHNAGAPPAQPKADVALREFLQREPRKPALPVPVVTPEFGPAGDLDVTWLGHGTSLVEIEGKRVLFDPVFSDRCSPSRLFGPKRVHPVPVRIENLPELDVIAISHDHYDHLDLPSVRMLLRTQDAPFVVPLGVGAHLEGWGVPASRIVELDWDESTTVAGLTVTATQAHHFSGRLFKRNPTLWCSFVVAGAQKKVYYSGDSGFFAGYADIGEAYGPFDVTLIQIGAYSKAWPDIHMTPEEGVAAHQDLRGGLLVPVHWGTFVLASHAWSEPPQRVADEAEAQGVTVAIPRPGERITVGDPPVLDHWWKTIS